MAKKVRSGLVTPWRLAGWPTRRSPSSEKATMDGVVRAPFRILDHLGRRPFHDGDAGIGGAEVDADNFSHVNDVLSVRETAGSRSDPARGGGAEGFVSRWRGPARKPRRRSRKLPATARPPPGPRLPFSDCVDVAAAQVRGRYRGAKISTQDAAGDPGRSSDRVAQTGPRSGPVPMSDGPGTEPRQAVRRRHTTPRSQRPSSSEHEGGRGPSRG